MHNVFQSPGASKKRKGFSLVELVVVILIIAILAVAVFAGGSAVIKRSQVSRTTSDLHNFSVAIESAVNETPSVANMKAASTNATYDDLQKIVDAVNSNLATVYQLKTTPVAASTTTGNIKFTVGASYIILESAKTDAWDNPYYVIFDFGERHCKGQSDFYITVVSAGPNAQTNVGGNIECDDVFLLVQYSDGDVSAMTYNMDTDSINTTTIANSTDTTYTLKANTNAATTKKGVTPETGALLYAGGADNTTYTGGVLPVNF
jgi:prepilin-type N-terminal cleavage/methylation domain-containing protein